MNAAGTPDSLDPLEDLVGGELGFQQQHFESLDSKAGIILGFAATRVALGRVRDDALGRFPDSLTRVAILDTRVQMIDANMRLLQQKARRMKAGASLLMAAKATQG